MAAPPRPTVNNPLRAVLIACLFITGCEGGKFVFDSARWAARRGIVEGENVRLGMTADLPDAGVVPGATRTHIHALLGQPDKIVDGRDIYALGRGSDAPDHESLVIHYDSAGKVTKVVPKQS